MMSFFCIFGKHLLSLVMLACRIPRGSIFVVATRDYLLLALTNQPSAALWESRAHLQIQGGLLKYSRCYSRLFSYVGASPACAPCCCVLPFGQTTSVCPYGITVNLLCRAFLLLFERQKVKERILQLTYALYVNVIPTERSDEGSQKKHR